MNWITKNFKYLGVLLTIVALFAAGVSCGRKLREKEIAELTTRLAENDKTIELDKDLYAKNLRIIQDLNILLKVKDDSSKELSAQIDKMNAQILSLNQLVVKWKKAYEGALQTGQTEQPPANPGDPVRKRVDFKRDFGFIGASGYTLTDPPEGFIKIEQLRPLKLTLAVTKNKDGTWSSLVQSSEDNVQVDIGISGLDLSVIKPRWYQKLWVDSGTYFLGGAMATIGASYRGDRWSLGASCAAGDAKTCGITIGFKPF